MKKMLNEAWMKKRITLEGMLMASGVIAPTHLDDHNNMLG